MKYIYAKKEKREKLLATLVRKIIDQGDDCYEIYYEVHSFAVQNI
jgi:hypothetical protein